MFRSEQIVVMVWNWYVYIQKLMKVIVDLYKKVVGVYNVNEKVKVGINVVFNVKFEFYWQFGIDKMVFIFGDFIFKKFRFDGKMVDMVCEKIIQSWFGLCVGVEVVVVGVLVDVQVCYVMSGWFDILECVWVFKNLFLLEVFEKEMVLFRMFKCDWVVFCDLEKSVSVMCDVCMVLVVLLIESGNFVKMMYDCIEKGDSKSWVGLVVFVMMIVSGVIDIWGVVVKEMQMVNVMFY